MQELLNTFELIFCKRNRSSSSRKLEVLALYSGSLLPTSSTDEGGK
jgi:hypothetical protein